MSTRKEEIVLNALEGKKLKIWSCKIGYAADSDLPNGADLPMRLAVEIAFRELTHHYSDFIFSGWDATLTEGEQCCVDQKFQTEK